MNIPSKYQDILFTIVNKPFVDDEHESSEWKLVMESKAFKNPEGIWCVMLSNRTSYVCRWFGVDDLCPTHLSVEHVEDWQSEFIHHLEHTPSDKPVMTRTQTAIHSDMDGWPSQVMLECPAIHPDTPLPHCNGPTTWEANGVVRCVTPFSTTTWYPCPKRETILRFPARGCFYQFFADGSVYGRCKDLAWFWGPKYQADFTHT